MMRTKIRTAGAMLAVIAAMLMTSCGPKEDTTEGAPPMGGAEEAFRTAEPVKIGALFAVTGPASFLGAPESKTATMLIEHLNQNRAGGDRPLQLIVKDTAGDPEKCMSFAKQLIEEENVVAIIGPSTSGETMKIKALCEQARVPLVSCAAAEVIVNPIARYVFKTPQKDSQAVTWIYRTMKDMGISKVGLVTGNTGFGAAGKEQLETLAPGLGIEVLVSEVYDSKATDLTDILAKLKARNVEAVVNWSIVPAQAIVPKNMRQLGMDAPLFQSHGFGNIKYVEQAGAAAEGILFPAGRLLVVDQLADDHPQKQVLAQYKKNYEDIHNEAVSTFGGHAYDALMIVVEALKAKGPTRDGIRDGIEGLEGFVGTGGVFTFSPEDHNGLGLDAFEMLTVKDGKFALYRK